MVSGEKWLQRWLHTFVGYMRGRENSCLTQQKDGSFKPKVRYNTQPTAAKSALALFEKYGRPMDAYRCWFCKGWHIGGAAHLTVGKFFSILWVWLIGRKREGNKHRLKARYAMAQCERCGKDVAATIMSMFNTEMICIGTPDSCKEREEQDPRYKEAVAADEAAIRAGDYNFKGIGR
jgi:hypothetical protein